MKFLKFDKIKLKRLEYIYLSAAIIGIIGYSSDLRIWLSSNQLEFTKDLAIKDFNRIRREVDNHYCHKFVRSEFSPDNLEELQEKNDLVCEWFKKIGIIIPKNGDDLPDINLDSLPRISVDDSLLNYFIFLIYDLIEEYNNMRREYFELVDKSHKSDFEVILSFFSPLLICLALGIRITKVTGELVIEKNNKANSPRKKNQHD